MISLFLEGLGVGLVARTTFSGLSFLIDLCEKVFGPSFEIGRVSNFDLWEMTLQQTLQLRLGCNL